ncbi:hypothetical protein SAMN05421866_2578 [Chryseobacterium oranimense]|uniref:Uncharacterized protein n=1 Tax=Chryseobacterium oranimense TaxID=421058 RepID=A0A1M5RZC7_9FLAO|nr:DUF6157 family protein [Chryseobacterium oranimense]CEJ71730.1 hypothetical protein BN1195_04080 [Chryseobacterium oranimense G311]SHH31550.1 hypothetical protein SAMN05421866_2578 [Chryseobacterium oranimense]
MKHTTNYINTFIEVAGDCPVSHAETPPEKKIKTLAELQYDKIIKNPYRYTSDDIIFDCYALKNDIAENEKEEAKIRFFSKGQPCLRSSPLAKRYGFGIHHNQEGKVAIFPVESKEYQNFLNDDRIKKVKAMRSKKI